LQQTAAALLVSQSAWLTGAAAAAELGRSPARKQALKEGSSGEQKTDWHFLDMRRLIV
jgi:hypothetical protein